MTLHACLNYFQAKLHEKEKLVNDLRNQIEKSAPLKGVYGRDCLAENFLAVCMCVYRHLWTTRSVLRIFYSRPMHVIVLTLCACNVTYYSESMVEYDGCTMTSQQRDKLISKTSELEQVRGELEQVRGELEQVRGENQLIEASSENVKYERDALSLELDRLRHAIDAETSSEQIAVQGSVVTSSFQ